LSNSLFIQYDFVKHHTKGIVAVPTRLLFKRFCFCSTIHSTALLGASRYWFESVQLLRLQEKIRSNGERLWQVVDEILLLRELDKRDTEFDSAQSPLSGLKLHHHPTPIIHRLQKSF
jgi:hypothetical protein